MKIKCMKVVFHFPEGTTFEQAQALEILMREFAQRQDLKGTVSIIYSDDLSTPLDVAGTPPT